MSARDLSAITDAEIDAEINQLRNAAAIALDPCMTAKLIALTDGTVRTLFTQKCLAGYPFRGIECLDIVSIPEYRSVYFDFDCKPNTLCLIRPAFLVTVNLITGQVVPPIRDPYIPVSFAAGGYSSTGSGCTCGTRPTRTSRRVYAGVRGDSIDAMKNLVGSVLGEEIQCNLMSGSGDCNSTERCRRAFRFLEAFHDDPNRDTVQDIADYINGSDRNKKCMRRIFEVADSDFSTLVVLIGEILGG